ncbi:flagellar biosynthesis protein FlhB, partial [Candidatus Saccharibacteria bacterium]|nr:flagellar biosynthesis protein FlhB [Candidatus Saccharibacteria bacterium]NIV73093.1 flagellar biosynthesis protein FlhB [Calditrichia bacterium]NIW00391.1 flagellar biosynthesis protein FlhB [Candidatus Saccharibacteria bacterium]NIW79544.1 flagellar biosynthesis protein FlhB [Calditrichia bacterium]
RQKGNVPKSIEVNSAMVLLFGIALLYLIGGKLYENIIDIFYGILNGGFLETLSVDNLQQYLLEGIYGIGSTTLLFMIGIMCVGLASNIMQVGFLLTLEPITPKPEKINPFKGIKKTFFSSRALEELIKNLLKLTIVITIAYFAVMSYKNDFPPLIDQGVGSIASFMVHAAFSVSLKIALALVLIAVADYAFQRYEHIKGLKMSKQEVKDENKQLEGDPKIKSRIRSLQMEMARNRMMQEIPKADVVITNPTHYAIALKYNPEAMQAPKLVAKGRNNIAHKIREVAREHNIPIMEDPPLAQAIYKTVELNQQLPERFFQAVAEVLAYVYKLKNKSL